jgi:hypothetical protein
LHFPTELSELKEVAIEFQGKSSFGILDGCIVALDGWLCPLTLLLIIQVTTVVMELMLKQCVTQGQIHLPIM